MPDERTPGRKLPQLNERAQAEADARRTREAAALRENLRRRKAQSRAREEVSGPDTIEPAS